MAQFTITIGDTAIPRVQQVVDAYNAGTGENLTIPQYLRLKLKEHLIDVSTGLRGRELAEQDQATIEAHRVNVTAAIG